MRADIAKLANQINKMMMQQGQKMQQVQQMSIGCEICGESHTKRHIGQLAAQQTSRPAGALPGDTDNDPQVNVITLRNAEKETEESEKTLVARPPPPFPQRLKKKSDDRMFNKFLDMLSQIQLNLPLVDVLHEIPKYAKYIKDIVVNKRRSKEFEMVALTEECSARVQSKLPPKLKDPGCFTILLAIRKHEVGRALCDMGESINLMTLSVFKQLNLGAPKPTTITLQVADWSLVVPEGIIEDMLVRVRKFIFSADFIILDYMADEEVPIILG
ncbi:PREDICTED: uncharacterized protein LOC109243096 [Nicotiana attenuata]|uniref:uncharacterized protein LOC109243096 n=1 Tax=Nicotiana attenuata TaxID=49451 RepID=UPI0009059C35|nr:PREDICTED: uncharacterized protein LOC109243096 [Nicotiana attenuata]